MNDVLAEWISAASAELAIETGDPIETILDMARDVAHGVARPAAPLTAYLIGLAVGAGADLGDAAQRVSRLAQDWAASHPAE
jgi:hypothetical protein